MTSSTPDYVLEAHFKTLLRKARYFDWLATRLDEAQLTLADGKRIGFDAADDEDYTLVDFCEQHISSDPQFQWLKD